MAKRIQSILRSEAFFRSRGPGHGPDWIDCGILLKSRSEQGYRDRIQPDRFVVIYVLRGRGSYIDGQGGAHRVRPGDFIPHLPGSVHSVIPDADGQWAEFFIQVPAVFFRALSEMDHLPNDDGVRHPGLRTDLALGIEELMDAIRRADEPDAPRLLNQAHALLNRFYRPPTELSGDPTHQAAIEAACDALSKPDAASVDIAALAEQHGLSYERLRKLFRQSVGLPPGEYRIRRRIDRARAMIAEQGLSNKAIAFALGYPDPFAFSKQFKKYVGMSPSAFRRHL